MIRPIAVVVAVCLWTSGVAHADEPASETHASLEAPKETEFNFFVQMAARASLAGRNDEAAAAYRRALELQQHPVISGRLGLILVKLGQLDKAAQELHEAVVHGQGVAPGERQAVGAAYDKAKALTTWVTVDISHARTKVTYDGVPTNLEGYSSYTTFAMPGEHTLRATLDGHEDAEVTFTAKPGEEIAVSLKLVPLPLPAPSPQVKAPSSDTRRFPPPLRSSNVAGDPNYDPKEDPFYGEPKETKREPKKTGPRFSVHAGVVTVFGVASWNPAVGPVVGVGLRPHENISFGLEGRAAWLTTGVGDAAIRAMSVGGLLSPCGHWKWFFGCGLGYVGVVNIKSDSASFKEVAFRHVKLGGGARMGARFRPAKSFTIDASADLLVLDVGSKVFVEKTLIADQPPVMLAMQLVSGWEL